MTEQRRFLMMAGGTGGHVFPALATARALEARGHQVYWLGASGGMEQRLIGETDIPLSLIHISGLRGKGKLDIALWRWMEESTGVDTALFSPLGWLVHPATEKLFFLLALTFTGIALMRLKQGEFTTVTSCRLWVDVMEGGAPSRFCGQLLDSKGVLYHAWPEATGQPYTTASGRCTSTIASAAACALAVELRACWHKSLVVTADTD